MSKTGYLDFHCHLDDPCFEKNRWQLIDQCFSLGFTKLVTVADPFTGQSIEKTAEMLAYHPDIHAVIGAHPHQADGYSPEIEKSMVAFYQQFKIFAVGEVGLDYHYNFSKNDNQINVLKRQIAMAREWSLPLVIHSRKAEETVLKILDKEKFPNPVVFHCYTGNKLAANEILQRGYFISFSGIITFKNANELREIVEITPLRQMFYETDSPYLAPEPNRGEINTPLSVIQVVEKIAAIKNVNTMQINAAISQNLLRLIAKN
ncbi:MAG: TatD family hydrolase [Candidatus Aminicenantes bacterium]|nr:TatD family hydrolase [Candidatus Aminicenantes bacterium]